jgi:hypothetical protein
LQAPPRESTSAYDIFQTFSEVCMAKSWISTGVVVSFLAGTLLGSGSLWQWKQSKLEGQKQELETIVKTTGLRQQEIDQYSRIIELTNEYINDNEQFSKIPSQDLYTKIRQLKSRLDVMKRQFHDVGEESCAFGKQRTA